MQLETDSPRIVRSKVIRPAARQDAPGLMSNETIEALSKALAKIQQPQVTVQAPNAPVVERPQYTAFEMEITARDSDRRIRKAIFRPIKE